MFTSQSLAFLSHSSWCDTSMYACVYVRTHVVRTFTSQINKKNKNSISVGDLEFSARIFNAVAVAIPEIIIFSFDSLWCKIRREIKMVKTKTIYKNQICWIKFKKWMNPIGIYSMILTVARSLSLSPIKCGELRFWRLLNVHEINWTKQKAQNNNKRRKKA